MKTILAITMATIMAVSGVLAQNAEKSTTDLKAELAAMQTRLAAAEAKEGSFTSKFAGFGREMGQAMNGFVEAMDGGMKVTTTRINEFAQTDVGKYAMIGIGWKIFADDILGVIGRVSDRIIGFLLFILFFVVLRYGIQLFFWGKMIVTKTEGPWYAKKITKERTMPIYDQLSRNGSSDQQIAASWMGGVLIITMAALFLASFIMIV